MSVGRCHGRSTRWCDSRANPLEEWVGLVVTQLLSPKHQLFTRAGALFGFWVGWHVYTVEGNYVGSFRDALERGDEAELFSAGGHYLGERDPQHPDRLAVDLSKRSLRRRPLPELPALPPRTIALYAVRDELPPRDGWHDFPAPGGFRPPSRAARNVDEHGQETCSPGRAGTFAWSGHGPCRTRTCGHPRVEQFASWAEPVSSSVRRRMRLHRRPCRRLDPGLTCRPKLQTA